MAEVTHYNWYLQFKPNQWEPWLLALPDHQANTHWTKLQWYNWYFDCRVWERHLEHQFIGEALFANLEIDDNCRLKRSRGT